MRCFLNLASACTSPAVPPPPHPRPWKRPHIRREELFSGSPTILSTGRKVSVKGAVANYQASISAASRSRMPALGLQLGKGSKKGFARREEGKQAPAFQGLLFPVPSLNTLRISWACLYRCQRPELKANQTASKFFPSSPFSTRFQHV